MTEVDVNLATMEHHIVHDTIQQRRSIGVLVEPAPSMEQLQFALTMAWSAPDHRRLKPTQFVIIPTEQRAAFAEVLVKTYQHDLGDAADPVQIEKIRQQPFRAPILVLAFTKIKPHEKVPTFEQLLSTGAAIQNVLLSLHAQGFASMWRTGALVESSYLKQYFGLTEQDYIAGIIYIGSAPRALPPRPDDLTDEFIRIWSPHLSQTGVKNED